MKQDENKKAQEIIEAARLKSQFLASMSHELRTPLNSVIGFSELLMDGLVGDLNEKQRHYISIIHSSGSHLLRLVNDILDYSRLEAGMLEIFNEPTEISTVIWEVLKAYNVISERKGIELKVEVEPLETILTDRRKLAQIVDNLLSNAVKFTEKGTIVIKAGKVGDKLLVSVSDTGIGIEEEEVKKVFEAFHQVDGTTTRRYEGTGLGLALVKKLLEIQGGSIDVKSAPGAGSTFTVKLPYVRFEQPAHPKDKEELKGKLPPVTDKPILVVEDNPLAANLMSVWLGEAGYKVEVATTGEEALSKALTLIPAAITLDILLPEMDGWRVLHRLKEIPETKDIPIIVVSIVEDKSFGLSLGAVDYMVKPVARVELLSKIEKLASSGRRTKRVLVIDDNPADISLIEEMLKLDGYEVLKAASGVEGLKKARADKPDLVVLDLMMPDLDGFDVMRLMESDEVTKGLPVILFTAKDLTEIDRANLSHNIRDIFTKAQLDRTSLRKKIGDLLGHKAEEET